MTELPPPFYSDPIRGVLALEPNDPGFIGPHDLTRLAAVYMLARDDEGMTELLYGAWRSGAPDELLGETLGSYAAVHDLTIDQAAAVYEAAHVVFVEGGGSSNRLALAIALREEIGEALESCLTALQGDAEACHCPACIAVAAALN